MGYKLELDLPNYGKGVEVYLEGLGLFENGYDYEVSDEEASAFRVAHQKVTYHTDEETGLVTHTTVEDGPTVLEYFKAREGLTVTTLKGKKTAKDTENKNKDTGNDPVTTQGGPQSNNPVVPVVDGDPDDGSKKEEGGDNK